MIAVEVAQSADAELAEALSSLIPQLSSSSPPPTLAELAQIVADPATTLLVARDGGRIVGTLTLAVFRVPTGVRAWVEDVVVDGGSRGAGAASALVTAALTAAEQCGARTVDLTSRPEREAANRLYQRLGFELRTTNVYRRALHAPA